MTGVICCWADSTKNVFSRCKMQKFGEIQRECCRSYFTINYIFLTCSASYGLTSFAENHYISNRLKIDNKTDENYNTSLDTKMSLLTCSVYVWKFDIPDTSSWTNSAAWHITSFALTWCLRSCVGTFNLLNSLMPTKDKEYVSLWISVFNYNKVILYNNIGVY